jgi:rubrerythrin
MSEGRYTRIEAVDVARQLEVCGEAFYDEAMKHARGKSVQTLLRHLRDEERAHSRSFDRLLSGLDEAEGDWRHAPEYLVWMRSFARRRVFPSPDEARKMAETITSDEALLDKAIEFELQTVEFLDNLRDHVREEDRGVIDELIAEEQEHERLLRHRRAALHG